MIRDDYSKALLSNDELDRDKYRMIKKQNKRIEQLERKVAQLENFITELMKERT